MRRSVQIKALALLVLALLAAGVWYAVLREHRGLLVVSFLDIGQGDSIYIEAPSGKQVLIDGGPDSSVLRRLASAMPWWDRSIDVLVATHPDADHIGGLVDVLPRYTVDTIVQSSVQGSTATWKAFEKEISEEGAHVVIAERGQSLDLGGGARLDILFPDRNLQHVETNLGCVVARLVYGSTSFLLPCDTTSEIEKYLVRLGGSTLKSTVLKAAHHGSKTSSSPLFVGFVAPQFAVISRSCDNKYGHPNQETLDTFNRFAIPFFDTCKDGTVTFISDGQTVARK